MKTRDVLINHLISFMENQEEVWKLKDTDSRYIYANKATYSMSCLPMNFDIEGRRNSECPLSWSEYADKIDAYEQIVIQSDKPMFFIASNFVQKERTFEYFLVKGAPYYNQDKIAGTITHSRKIFPRLLSEHFFKNPVTPAFLTNHPPNNLFTTEELNVLFFAVKLMSNQEIALHLGTYCCVVEQIIQQIYRKIDIHSRKQLRDYGIVEGFDNYFPPFLLKGLL